MLCAGLAPGAGVALARRAADEAADEEAAAADADGAGALLPDGFGSDFGAICVSEWMMRMRSRKKVESARQLISLSRAVR